MGTTAEIRSGHGGSAGEDADGSGGGGGLAVMARGRHRFRLVEDLGWRCAAQTTHSYGSSINESFHSFYNFCCFMLLPI